MGEDLISHTLKDEKVKVASQGKSWIKYNPIKLVLVIGFLHIVVSIALLLYTLYFYVVYGHFSTLTLVVLMIWLVGAFVIISLGYIGKKISRQILKDSGKLGHM